MQRLLGRMQRLLGRMQRLLGRRLAAGKPVRMCPVSLPHPARPYLPNSPDALAKYYASDAGNP
jgi:hypothetical protein